MKRPAVVLLIIIVIAGFFVYPVFFKEIPVRVRTSATPGTVHIGDSIKYVFEVTASRNTELKFPDIRKNLSDFVVRQERVLEKVYPRNKKVTKEFRIARYKPGVYSIPEMSLTYRNEGASEWQRAEAPETLVLVKGLVKMRRQADRRVKIVEDLDESLVYGGAGAGGRDVQPHSTNTPIRYYINEVQGPKKMLTYQDVIATVFFVIAWAVAGAIILLFIVWNVKRSFSKKLRSADEIAVEKIKQLKSWKVFEEEREREFCAELYSYMREYLQNRFDVPLVGKSGDELVVDIDNIKALNAKQKNFLKERFSLYELVKYSGYKPDKEELSPDLKDEIKFVRDTKKKDGE